MRVLIVDDNRDIVSSLMEMLRLVGHECKGVPDANNIVREVREFAPEVVILDITMPGKSGWAAAREIRAVLPQVRPTLIGISGDYQKASDKILAEMSGFDHYLMKPADPKRVIALLAEIPRNTVRRK